MIPPPPLSVLYTILGWGFWSKDLEKEGNTDLWERDLENLKQTHLYCNRLSLWEREQGPEGSALNLLQFQTSLPSFQAPLLGQHFNLSISLPPSSSLFIHLFHSLVSFSHSFWLPQSLALISPRVSSFCWSLHSWPPSKSSRFESAPVENEGRRWGWSEARRGIATFWWPMYSKHSPPPCLQAGPCCCSLSAQTPLHTQVCTREDLIIPCRENQRPLSPIRQLVSIRCSKPYKYSLFSLISYYFSFPFLMFPPLDSLLGGGLN